jgi:hypothetical protein
MHSASLERWKLERQLALDEIEDAHKSIGGSGRGRRYATQQINYAYTMLLSSQFQAFCRDLHTECADFMVENINPKELQIVARSALLRNRKLDQGNPNPGNLGHDFAVYGFSFWNAAKALDLRNERRMVLLEKMNEWRNAIAHHDFSKQVTGGTLALHTVRAWRSACYQLAESFDEVVRQRVETVNGKSPW